jgi:hypothetical protein
MSDADTHAMLRAILADPTSWWNETPWPEIREHARLSLSPRQFREWLKRPDVIERRNREPKP